MQHFGATHAAIRGALLTPAKPNFFFRHTCSKMWTARVIGILCDHFHLHFYTFHGSAFEALCRVTTKCLMSEKFENCLNRQHFQFLFSFSIMELCFNRCASWSWQRRNTSTHWKATTMEYCKVWKQEKEELVPVACSRTLSWPYSPPPPPLKSFGKLEGVRTCPQCGDASHEETLKKGDCKR